ncbi:response regulator [Pontibacter sp. JAM-7]|uniref:response regulator n=1 Tax=Pontibacter sp. JAM-7 TaxID=3366581 RepID=UPI003AF57FB4
MSDNNKSTILIVDDEAFNIVVLSDLLKAEYRIIVAKSGEQALNRVHDEVRPDLILLDIMMPDMDGYEVCSALKADPATANIPVIFVSAMSDGIDEDRGLKVGAIDYIRKPVTPAIVRSRVRNHLALKIAQDQLSRQNEVLEALVQQRTAELVTTQDVTIMALASLAETRDNETGNHIRRTQHYVKILAEELVAAGHYTDELTPENIELLYKSAPLHDIGKVGIPDSILLKPGKLEPEEFRIMMTHAELGAKALQQAGDSLCSNATSFLRYARDIAACHHEKWDGKGYPRGLSGDDIPLSARLMSLADVYDALISKRVYKPAFSHEKAASIILEGRGTHFEPVIVDAFQRTEQDFQVIAARYKDVE